ERGGREVGVQVLDPATPELVLQRRVRGRAGEERVPGREDLVHEPRFRDFCSPDRAAEPVVLLQHADRPPRSREQRGGDERVDPAPDRDGVVAAVHERFANARSTLSRARRARAWGSTSQSESGNASPKVPLSEKISTSYQPS